jgi:TRAP-type mannitol/chloroaromatic compound transport system permease small subunit
VSSQKIDRLQQTLSALSEWSGRAVAWLTLPMVIGTSIVVVLRYAFDLGWIWMQESVTWMHAAVFMLGAAYTLRCDEHVRVDIIYRDLPVRRRAIVDLLGSLCFLIPMAIFIGWSSWDYVISSWSIREGSREAGGLPYPFVPLLKSIIPAAAGLLVLQGIADILRSALVLAGWTAAAPAPHPPAENL